MYEELVILFCMGIFKHILIFLNVNSNLEEVILFCFTDTGRHYTVESTFLQNYSLLWKQEDYICRSV